MRCPRCGAKRSALRIDEEEVRARYEAGEALERIGERYGVGACAVYQWTKRQGWRREKAKYTRPEDVRRVEAVRMYVEERKTATEIARGYGLTPAAVGSWLRDAGVKMRRRSDYRKGRCISE